jgi:hypothetical protein
MKRCEAYGNFQWFGVQVPLLHYYAHSSRLFIVRDEFNLLEN